MTRSRFLTACLLAGYAFLYIPIALLVLTSFNASRLTTVWTGFSFRWFVSLASDDQLVSAAWLSLRIALVSATLATILGMLAGLAMARFGRFPGRQLFAALLATPLLLPEVLIGISLLLLFVAVQQLTGYPTERGAGTIELAHVSFTLSFVAIVVEARLTDSGTLLEEAAMDLGASPLQTFLRITLPLLSPALVSGWLLAFTLSLDDLVVTSFVSGPGASTLPMVVFSTLRLGATPELNALATVVLAVVAMGLLVAWRLSGRFSARRRAAA
jgi:putrescine transport system permease protein